MSTFHVTTTERSFTFSKQDPPHNMRCVDCFSSRKNTNCGFLQCTSIAQLQRLVRMVIKCKTRCDRHPRRQCCVQAKQQSQLDNGNGSSQKICFQTWEMSILTNSTSLHAVWKVKTGTKASSKVGCTVFDVQLPRILWMSCPGHAR